MLELDGKTIAKDTAHFGYRTWRSQSITQLEAPSQSVGMLDVRKKYAYC